MSFHGQHVLVTASAGGMGSEICKLLLSLGAKVSMHYNKNCASLQFLLNEYPNTTYALSVNAENEEEIVNGMEKSYEKFGVINIIILPHIVYVTDDIPIWEMSLEQWNKTLNVNLTSYFLYTREWCKQLIKHKPTLSTDKDINSFNANIIYIGSAGAKFGEENHIDYAACKGAIHTAFLHTVKNEIVKIFPNARANVISPGLTLTPLTKQIIDKNLHSNFIRTQTLHKVATPNDIAQACAFMASNVTANHITGHILDVDGGQNDVIKW
ncbi:unnamed protein product [Didymodactylos carnosus]|uniref:Uncharacterized protein n=1 Tax=Didymodactylos carnosus TaxID=1234261 RepID=A0A816A4M4_9BILA|nr:unnamed protein product [Didymodactylos carnosus]CAF1592970.1 unnamed protein product [Didymodactylos carnosus]CAF3568592.1 unnamed protein product [Didymodactylos carnosus]CAF4465968.1 unnamed protein product [Didymodactylos carnosus]